MEETECDGNGTKLTLKANLKLSLEKYGYKQNCYLGRSVYHLHLKVQAIKT